MSKQFLVALSDTTSDTVLSRAIDTARAHGASLTVLHVVDPAPYLAMTSDYTCGLLFESLEASGLETAHRFAHALDKANYHATIHTAMLSVGETTVARKIASFAEAMGASLIIVGARKSRWPSWLCPNVTTGIQHATATPLQIVPQAIAPASTRAPSPAQPGEARQYAVHHRT
jgi:nucleotide-binding universal stress UspA family protein